MPGIPNDVDLEMAELRQIADDAAATANRPNKWGEQDKLSAAKRVADAWYHMDDTRYAFQSYCDDLNLPFDWDVYNRVLGLAERIVRKREITEGIPTEYRVTS